MRKLIITLAAVAGLGLVGAGATTQAAQASSSCYYSVRGCVHVNGYYKPSTGTYVRPYVRNYPSYGSYRYSYPRYSYSSPRYSYSYPRYRYSYPRYSYSYSSYW